MADLNSLLAKYDLEGGDVVYVDTGLYTPSVPWRISQADSAGTLATNPVVFQGSTNSLVNGTVIDRNFQSGGVGIQADYAIGIKLRNFAVSNALGSAVAFNNCYGASRNGWPWGSPTSPSTSTAVRIWAFPIASRTA